MPKSLTKTHFQTIDKVSTAIAITGTGTQGTFEDEGSDKEGVFVSEGV